MTSALQAFWMLSLSPPPPLIVGVNPRNGLATKRSGLSVLSCSKTLDKPQSSAPPWSSSHAKRDAIAQIKAANDLDSALSRADGILHVQDLNFILRHFGESRKWREVSQIFDWMQTNETCNFVSYSSFIKYMGISHNPMKALQVYDGILDKSMKVNVSVCNSILGCLVRNGRFESSIKLFTQMKADGLSPDLVTYSSLLAGCTKLKDGYSKAMQLVDELKDRGLRMDSVIYGNLLAICASNSLCEEAEILFQQMTNEGNTPNLFHYSSLLNAYSEDGNYGKADLLIKDMKSVGLAPNKVILTTLLKVYAKGGLFEKSHELLAELESLGYAEDEMPYCLLMDNLAKTGHMHEAREIFAMMKEKDVKSDGYSYSIMISALCRNGLLQEARQLAKEFEANHTKFDLVMLNTLLRVYCNAGDMDSAMQMLRKMDELKISPDWNTFHILIKYFCRERLYHLAYQTAEDMHRKGHQLDEEFCTSLILQLGRAGSPSEALSVYNMLRYSKRRLDKSLHEKVLDILVPGGLLKEAYVVMKDNAELIPMHSLEKFTIAFMKSGNINSINDVLKALHRSGCSIDMDVFRLAISRYVAKPEKKDLLLQLLSWMSGQGYVVDSSSRNLLLKKSHLFGEKHLIAEILSKQHMMSRKLVNGEAERQP